MKIVRFPRPPLRSIELRQVNMGDRWQAVYPGDEWTRHFISTVAPYAAVREGIARLEHSHGLPLVTMPGYFEEVAA